MSLFLSMIIIVSHKPLAILALSWIQEVGSPEKQFHCLLPLTLASKYTNSLEILKNTIHTKRVLCLLLLLVQEILGTSSSRRVYLQISVLSDWRELFAHCPGLWVTTVATLHTVQRWVGEVEAEGQI